MPIIENTPIIDTISGPETFTPDHKCLIGESPTIDGLYYNIGHNSMGITNSGLSLELAKIIINGYSENDIFNYDIKRFANTLLENDKYIKETSHESYAKNYSIVFPNDQHVSGRNIIQDPLYNILMEKGCFYISNKSGYEIPYHYGVNHLSIDNDYDINNSYNTEYFSELKKNYTFDFQNSFEIIRQEHLHTRNQVSLFNQSSFGKILLTGKDSIKCLELLCTNKINKRNKTTYTMMCNESGKIECDITVSKINDSLFYINTGGLFTNYTIFWINKRILKNIILIAN